MLKKLSIYLLIFVFVFSTLGTNVFATQEGVELTEKDITIIKNFLTKYKIEDKVQHKLIEKYKKGEMWDSIKSSEQPVRVLEADLYDIHETISYYKDGSVTVISLPKEIYEGEYGDIGTKSVSGGNWKSGSGYSNCYGAVVRVNHGVVDMSFKADFSLVHKGKSEIMDVYHGDYYVAGGVVTAENLRINRKIEDYNHPAEAEYSVNFDLLKMGASWKYTLWLKVQGSRYWDENQFWEK